MSHALDRFMNDVRVRLPGAIDDVIKLEMFNVLDEFCKETNAWQEKIILPVNSQKLEYEIESEEWRGLIVNLLGVTMGGYTGVNAWMPNPETIVFQLPPSDEAEYVATVALTVIDPVNPDDILPEFPEYFLTTYSQELLDGVLSKMLSQPSKPYTSRDGFLYHGKRFRNGLSRVRRSVNHGNTYGTQRWIFPSFARCNTR